MEYVLVSGAIAVNQQR